MQLKYPRDIAAQDLPLIESPFFAADRVRSVLSSYYAHERSRLMLPSGILAYGQDRGSQTNQLCSRVRAGELLLVYSESERRQLFSPVVSWRAGDGTGSSGQWMFHEDPLSCPGIRDAVAGLNRNGVTPRDLNSAMGIGGAKAAHIDSEVRRQKQQREESPSPDRREPEPSRRTIIPPVSSASAAIAAELTPDKPAVPEKEPPLEIVAGLFTDGTLNNVDNSGEFERRVEEQCPASMLQDPAQRAECEERLKLLMGESYANAPTNVAKLWQLYDDSNRQVSEKGPIVIKIYSPGAGTNTGGDDSIIGMATGLGETGVPQQVRRLFMELASLIRNIGDGEKEYRIVFDLFGFSRGSAAARHAVNEILKGDGGMLLEALRHYNLGSPSNVEIRFVGLFDTVAGIINFSDLDFSPGNERTSPVKLHLNSKDVGKAVHLVAAHEKRANFSLNSLRDANDELPDNFREITMPGAHSDIGGGYPDEHTEEVALHPGLSIRGDDVRWPETTMEWDNLEAMRDLLVSEGWVGEYSFPLPNGEQPSLTIQQRRIEHPVPDGQVLLSLKMKRLIKGDYSTVALKIMYDMASEEGVPLVPLGSIEGTDKLSGELQGIYSEFTEQLKTNAQVLSLDPTTQKRILQRYIHHSDHYNLMKKVVGDDILNFEFPLKEFHPFRPTTQRIRVVHPNYKREESNVGRS